MSRSSSCIADDVLELMSLISLEDNPTQRNILIGFMKSVLPTVELPEDKKNFDDFK